MRQKVCLPEKKKIVRTRCTRYLSDWRTKIRREINHYRLHAYLEIVLRRI